MAKQQKAKRFPRVKRVLVNLFLGGNIFTLLLLWACCASTYIDPTQHPHLAVIGLAFPFIVLFNLLFIPFWLIYKPRLMLVPIVGIALCSTFLLDYCPIGLNRHPEKAVFRVTTWNCHDLSYYKGDSLELAHKYIRNIGSDIICLQEFNYGRTAFKPLIDSLASLGYTDFHSGSRVIFTRYPIVSNQVINSQDSEKKAIIRADVQIDDEILSVYCVHLESNKISPDDKEVYADVIQDPGRQKVENEVRHLTGKLSTAASSRANQVRAILANMDSLPEGRSVLLCGDFNDTPISYTYQTISRRLSNAFRQGGRGIGLSFSERYFPVRIDNIFFTSDWHCEEAYIDRSITASDHYPIHAALRRSK